MRHAAQKTLAMQDMLPADGSVYMTNMDNKMTSVMDALRAWEKKRGLSFSFKGKFLCSNPKKTEENKEKTKEKTKEKPTADRSVAAPRTPGKRGRRPQFTAEERKQRKNENNKQYRAKNNEAARARSKAWRAKLTPEQKAVIQLRNREHKRAKKAAAHAANGSGANGVSLADTSVS